MFSLDQQGRYCSNSFCHYHRWHCSCVCLMLMSFLVMALKLVLLTFLQAPGEDYSTDTRKPFCALLDVGLVMTTTGNRVFGALKGALDGGLDIPHSDKRFAGFNKEGKNLDSEIHRKYIYGGHVADYMKLLMEDEPEKYQSHFSNFLKKDLAPENMEEMYKNVHASIRADPSFKTSDKEAPKEHKRYNPKKLTYDERKASLIQRVKALNSAIGGDDDKEEEDDE